MISLETGALLSTKGYRIKEEEAGGTFEAKVNLMYLHIPVNARVGFDAGPMKIYGAVGPYVGVGLSAKAKLDIEADGMSVSETEDLTFGDGEDDDIKRLDYGLSIGAGAAFGAFEVGLNYDLGLANLSPYTENGYKANSRVFSITAAYKFGK